MNIYKTLRDISALRFHEIRFSGNILLLDEDYEEDKVYSNVDIINISESWLKMYDEYYVESDSNDLRKGLRDKKRGTGILMQINVVSGIEKTLNILNENKDILNESIKYSTVSSLSSSLAKITKRISIKPNDDLEVSLKKVSKFLKGLQSKYKLNFKKEMRVNNESVMLFYKIKAQIEDILGKNSISDDINMLQWLAYENKAKHKIKSSKSNGKQSDKRTRSNKNPR